MSSKPKVLIISGLTSIGKSEIARKVAKILNTDIIVADSVQIYKNFPIASNFPDTSDHLQLKYHLLGSLDVFTQRISSLQFKDMLLSKINELRNLNKIPLLEGGCSFYLKYAITSVDKRFDDEILNKAAEEARRIMKQHNNDPTKIIDHLKTLVNYENDLPQNDIYRINKALKYAIASNGETYKARKDENAKPLNELFDLRCFFLTKQRKGIIKDLHKRCDQLIEKGLVEETLAFIREANEKGIFEFERQKLSLPIGFVESKEFIDKVTNLFTSENLRKIYEINKIKNHLMEMATKFQASSRQYSQKQLKFSRSNFENFYWIDKTNAKNETIIGKIIENFHCKEEDYKKEQVKTLACKNLDDLAKMPKSVESEPLKTNYDRVIQQIQDITIPKIQKEIFNKDAQDKYSNANNSDNTSFEK